MNPTSRSLYYDNNGNTKFPFCWTNNPWRYKAIQNEELWVEDRRIVGVVEKFCNKLPTNVLVRIYLSVHPLVDLESIST